MSLKKNKRRKLVRDPGLYAGKETGLVCTKKGGGNSASSLVDDYDDYNDLGYGGSWRGTGSTYNVAGYNYKPHPPHRGDKPIKVGKYEVYAGAMRDLTASDLDNFDVLIPLTQDVPNFTFGHPYRILAAPLVDYGGVPENWGVFLKELVIPLLEGGHKMLAYCFGSHGRTGCFLASLISILEPETEDPIDAARKRHCKKAVESKAQATAVYALRGQELPKKWEKEFDKSYTTTYYGAQGGYTYGGSTSFEKKAVDPLPTTATGVVGKSLKEVATMTDDQWNEYAKENNIPIFT